MRAAAVLVTLVAAGALSGSSGAATTHQRTTAPSQELPPLRALAIIGTVSVQGYMAGSPTFRWKFPSRDGTAQYWVTMDDSALGAGVKLAAPGSSLYAGVSDWIYFPDGIPLADGTSTGAGWALYFYANACGGQNWFVMLGATETTAGCTPAVWSEITSDLSALPGAWVPVGGSFEACYVGIQWWGGTCLTRFISAAAMHQLVRPTTDVEVYDGQPWDVLCPVNVRVPPCWTDEAPSSGFGVDVTASAVQTPIDTGTTSDRFVVSVANPNAHEVAVTSIAADLPAGFAYVKGSTAGGITADPTAAGQRLTWGSPLVVAAGATLTFSFGVTIDPSLPGGRYAMTASAVTDATYSAAAVVTIGAATTPLIFVPGIMGSKLSCAGVSWWPDFAIDKLGLLFQSLALASHGSAESVCPAPLAPYDIVDRAWGSDEYDTTIAALEAAGYVPGKTLFAYPFDWRRSVTASAYGLVELIDSIRAQTHAPLVDVLAHSQGGLVTRVALSLPQSVGKVRRVLTMGTPFYGAAKLLAVLLTGKPCIPGDVKWSFLFLHVSYCPTNGATVQDVVQTLPGAYELLPSPAYFDAVRPPILLDGRAMTQSQYETFVESVSDPVLAGAAFQYHAAYDAVRPADASVQWTQVVGRGEATLSDVFLSTDPELDWASFLYGDGDGTVPAGSAGSGGLFTTMHAPAVDHMGLVQSSCSLGFVVHYFEDPTPPAGGGCVFAGYGSTFAARSLSLSRDAVPAATELAVDGSLTGSVSDAAGESTSSASDPIPNSDVNVAGASQSFLMRDPGSYHATFTAAASGIARLRVRALGLDGPLAQALFLLPAVPKGATLALDVDGQDVGASRIGVDLNGDGTTDEVLAPDAVTSGAALTDTTPPAPYGGATLAGPGTSRVTLAADDSGSGVARIYYRVGDGTERTYTGPFTVPMFSTISYRAMDVAGNMSDESSFVADDAPNIPRLADPLTPFQPVLRSIAPQGDVDWFTFQADGRSRYRIQLDQLPGDYDVQLLDAGGNLVAASHPHGSSPETIFLPLAAGKYYVEVGAAAGTNAADRIHLYRLQLLAVPGG